MLQATDVLRVQRGDGSATRPGLLQVEQRANVAVLRLRLVQSGSARGREEDVAQGLAPQRRRPPASCPVLLRRLLRLSERQKRIRRALSLPLRTSPWHAQILAQRAQQLLVVSEIHCFISSNYFVHHLYQPFCTRVLICVFEITLRVPICFSFLPVTNAF